MGSAVAASIKVLSTRLSSSVKNRRWVEAGGQPLLYVAVEFGDRRIDGVAGVDESGTRREPAHEIVDRPSGASIGERRARCRRARQIGELPL